MITNLTMSVEAIQKKLDEYCTALSKMGYLNGSVLVALEGNVLFSKGYGMANIEHEVANTPQTIFRIASITKQFTAAAILRLQENNLIHVNDPVANYLPDYPNGRKITIHHLLTHSSGIPDYTNLSDYSEKVKLPSTLEESVNKFKDLPLAFDPGERFEYSNSGYLLLSYIIEKITNKSFETYLKETIFSRLGMIQTGLDNYKKLLKNRASGYGVWEDIVNAEFLDMSNCYGDGGLYSTTEDLFIWDQALHTGKILNKDSYSLMTTIHEANYGYGLIMFEELIQNKARKVIAHGGGIYGFVGDYRNYINEKLTVIVLSNIFTTISRKVAESIAKIVLNEEVTLPELKTPISLNEQQYEHFKGDYKVYQGPYKTFTLSSQDGKLYLSNDTKWYKVEIYPFSRQGENFSFFTKGIEGGRVSLIEGELHVRIFNLFSKATKI